MAEMWAKKHPVVSGVVIAALGSMVFKEPRTLVASLFSGVWDMITQGYQWVVSDVSIPWWLFIILCLLSAIVVIQIGCHLLQKEEAPDFHEYREDFINGVKWRWGWHGRQIINLTAYCPNCDYQLTCIKPDRWSDDIGTSFYCDRCSSVISKIKGGGLDYALGVVRREIDRKVRNQLYPKNETP